MIHTGDCVEVMRGMEAESVDAIVTDPPYGLEFMGKEWDRLGGDVRQPGDPTFHKSGSGPHDRSTVRYGYGVPSSVMQKWHTVWATEALRVLKPGGYLLAFGGTRTVHRLASAIEDAGFEIRDELVWIYASGFPKSLDVGKAMDRAAGAEREVVVGGSDGVIRQPRAMAPGGAQRTAVQTMSTPATDLAKQWDGWGTALKPAHEPIVMARKPLQGTVAGNVAKWGTGALNIDGTRIKGNDEIPRVTGKGTLGGSSEGWDRPWKHDADALQARQDRADEAIAKANNLGRWPSNILLSDPELFDQPNPYVVGSGATVNTQATQTNPVADSSGAGMFGLATRQKNGPEYLGDSGGYSRFFIVPKADRADREPVLGGQVEKRIVNEATPPGSKGANSPRAGAGRHGARENAHPTVKPTDVMRHLVRLVTPPGGLVLDPFLGSGTTGIACELEGFPWVGIEREPEYVKIAEARLNGTQRGLGLDVPAPTSPPPNTHPDLSKHQPKRRTPSENCAGGWAGTLLREDVGRLPSAAWEQRCVFALLHSADDEPDDCQCGVKRNEVPA